MDGENRPYVAKISSADISWRDRKQLVTIQKAGDHQDERHRIPCVLGWRDSNASAASPIQHRLSNKPPSSPPSTLRAVPTRMIRTIVFERLERVEMLDGKGMMTVILQCVKCHYALWSHGIRHIDLSASNLMYRTIKGKICGAHEKESRNPVYLGRLKSPSYLHEKHPASRIQPSECFASLDSAKGVTLSRLSRPHPCYPTTPITKPAIKSFLHRKSTRRHPPIS
ncbi:hypothetical protein OF83DRAFT_896602 [Amylostereum chailletii]|nr:hypothetical protein OF83DRAFT_896602 [Amylostereum chailletii]